MKVLIYSEAFFGYADRIKDHLLLKNFAVDVKFFFVPVSSDRIKKKIFGIEYDQSTYYNNLLKDNTVYDVVLVINGKDLPDYFITAFGEKYKNCKKILYIWDDIKNLNPSKNFLHLFDKKYTYSKFDADADADLEFLPFFYTHVSNSATRAYDAAFVGTLHSDRSARLKEFKLKNPRSNFFFFIYADLLTYLKYFKKVQLRDVKFKALSYEQYIEVVSRSTALIELPHPTQRNITTRAIEVVGTRTKLITTSDAVKTYDFYNSNNIFIVDSGNISEIQDWLKQPYQEYSEEIRKKYYIDSWIGRIFP